MDENKPPELHGIERQRQTQREYYAKNKERFQEYKKRYGEKYAEQIKQRDREKYLRTRDKAIERERKKRAAASPSVLAFRERKEFFKTRRSALTQYHRYGKFMSWETFKEIAPRFRHGPCDICKVAGQVMRVDHCHAQNLFRGLLCHRCNMALGVFKDDSALLRAAADYLDRNSPSTGLS